MSAIACLGKTLFLLIVTCCALFLFCTKPADRHGMAFIKGKGNTFIIGQKGLANASPANVALDHDYYMDRTEITGGFFSNVMGYNPSFFKDDSARPVENVSFIEAAKFCNRRSVLDHLSPCYNPGSWMCDRTKNGYRLPTEAEWEYACRAGTKTTFFWGKKISPRYCWYGGNSGNGTHAVGTVKPNRFGLYDMAGNVWEWCDDRYEPGRTPKASAYWELGPKTLRGGSFTSTPDLLGSAVRDGGDPMGKSNGVGFRCVRNQ